MDLALFATSSDLRGLLLENDCDNFDPNSPVKFPFYFVAYDSERSGRDLNWFITKKYETREDLVDGLKEADPYDSFIYDLQDLADRYRDQGTLDDSDSESLICQQGILDKIKSMIGNGTDEEILNIIDYIKFYGRIGLYEYKILMGTGVEETIRFVTSFSGW